MELFKNLKIYVLMDLDILVVKTWLGRVHMSATSDKQRQMERYDIRHLQRYDIRHLQDTTSGTYNNTTSGTYIARQNELLSPPI